MEVSLQGLVSLSPQSNYNSLCLNSQSKVSTITPSLHHFTDEKQSCKLSNFLKVVTVSEMERWM